MARTDSTLPVLIIVPYPPLLFYADAWIGIFLEQQLSKGEFVALTREIYERLVNLTLVYVQGGTALQLFVKWKNS